MILDSTSEISALSHAQLQAWASGLALFDETPTTAEVSEFDTLVELLAACEDEVAGSVLGGIKAVLPPEKAESTKALPTNTTALAVPHLVETLKIASRDSYSVAFLLQTNSEEHCLLFELTNEAEGLCLSDIQLAGSHDLFDTEQSAFGTQSENNWDSQNDSSQKRLAERSGEKSYENESRFRREHTAGAQRLKLSLKTEAICHEEAIALVTQAWQTAVEEERDFFESVRRNEWLARAWIKEVSKVELPALCHRVVGGFEQLLELRDMSEREFLEANKSAYSTWRAAVPDAVRCYVEGDFDEESSQSTQLLADCINAAIPSLLREEFEALAYLEWADWLGVLLGLWRSGPETLLSGEVCVDLINRCAEVSSTIPAKHREYVSWCFEIALEYFGYPADLECRELSKSDHLAICAAVELSWNQH